MEKRLQIISRKKNFQSTQIMNFILFVMNQHLQLDRDGMLLNLNQRHHQQTSSRENLAHYLSCWTLIVIIKYLLTSSRNLLFLWTRIGVQLQNRMKLQTGSKRIMKLFANLILFKQLKNYLTGRNQLTTILHQKEQK